MPELYVRISLNELSKIVQRLDDAVEDEMLWYETINGLRDEIAEIYEDPSRRIE